MSHIPKAEGDAAVVFEGAGEFAEFDEFGGHSDANLMNRVFQEVPSSQVSALVVLRKKEHLNRHER